MDLPPSRKRDAPLIDVYGFSAPCDYGGAGILSRFSPSLSPLASLFFSRSIWGATEALRRRLASIDFITRLGRSSIQSRGLLLVLGYFCEFPRELRQGRLLAEDLRKPVADVRPLHVALEHVPALAYEVIDEQPPLGVRVEGPRPLLEVGLPLGERAPQVAPAVGGRRRRRRLLGG